MKSDKVHSYFKKVSFLNSFPVHMHRDVVAQKCTILIYTWRLITVQFTLVRAIEIFPVNNRNNYSKYKTFNITKLNKI